MYKVLVSLFCVMAASTSHAADKAEYLAFFNEYQRLISEFDVSVNKMYADDAKIMGARKKPDGTEESMTIDGVRWKTIILASMERAKKLGDRSEYSQVAIDVNGDEARISANRYSHLDCFHDKRFYIVVKAIGDNQLQIVEQFMETPAQSSCEESTANSSSAILWQPQSSSYPGSERFAVLYLQRFGCRADREVRCRPISLRWLVRAIPCWELSLTNT